MFKSILFAFLALGATAHSAQAADPVLIELYYESLCPYCMKFMREQLSPTWDLLRDTGESIKLINERK